MIDKKDGFSPKNIKTYNNGATKYKANNKRKIKVVNLVDENDFEKEINQLLELGYQISSTSCGFIDSKEYDFCTSFQAILFK